MSTIEEVLTYIKTSMPSVWNDTNAFVARMPDEPDRCLTVYEYAGTPQYTMSGGTPAFETVRVQVSIRSGGESPYLTARVLIRDIEDLLSLVGGQTLSGTMYHRMRAIDTPTRLEPDNQDRDTLVLNFEVMKERS